MDLPAARQLSAGSRRVSITRSMFTSKDFADSEAKSGMMPNRRGSTAWDPSSLGPSMASEPTRRGSISLSPTEPAAARRASFARSDFTFKRLAELPESDSGTKINLHLPGKTIPQPGKTTPQPFLSEHASAHHQQSASTLLGAKEPTSRFVLAGKDIDNLSTRPVAAATAARRASIRSSISNIPMAPVRETAAESPTHFTPSKYSPTARPATDKKDKKESPNVKR